MNRICIYRRLPDKEPTPFVFVEDRTEVRLVLASSQDPLVRAVWVPVERHFQGVECLLQVFYKTVKFPIGLLVTYQAMRDALDWLESE